MGDWLRTLLRSWLGVDDTHRRVETLESAVYLQGRAIGKVRQDVVNVRAAVGERGKALYLGRDDRPVSDDEKRARVDNVLGPDPQTEGDRP